MSKKSSKDGTVQLVEPKLPGVIQNGEDFSASKAVFQAIEKAGPPPQQKGGNTKAEGKK